MNNELNETSLKKLIIDGIQDLKGRNITVVDMSHIEDAAVPMFVIAEGTSTTQVTSIADHLREYALEHAGVKPYNYDGYRAAEWIVIDYGTVLAHIFTREARQHYNLEELWSDATLTQIPDLD